MSGEIEKKKLLNKVLTYEGFVMFLVGLFFAIKPHFSDFIFIDSDIDLYLGYALILTGFINIFIANKFFNYKKVK